MEAPVTSALQEPLRSLHLITWNIDYMAVESMARMTSAISYLEGLVASIPATSAVVIHLQEMTESGRGYPGRQNTAKDFTLLCHTPWIRKKFYMSDINMSTTDGSYGQATLIDRRLHVAKVSRLRFVSEYQRDAIFVDIRLSADDEKYLRLCNVHLDSMSGELRPIQWKAVSSWLHKEEEGVVASILAGDCNANRPRDKTEPQENGFKDAYLELGGVEDDEEGNTWGYQSVQTRYKPTRMDKVAFWGDIEVKHLERIGVGVQVEDEHIANQLVAAGWTPFVTDHYGLMCEFSVDSGVIASAVDDQPQPSECKVSFL
jgi:tyrosyl-DNA phosphodiesterase 2